MHYSTNLMYRLARIAGSASGWTKHGCYPLGDFFVASVLSFFSFYTMLLHGTPCYVPPSLPTPPLPPSPRDAFQLLGMAERGFLPEAFTSRSKHGTPLLGILASASGVILLSWMTFQEVSDREREGEMEGGRERERERERDRERER